MPATAEPERSLRVLWVTTKIPWPAHDGGRMLMDGTLRALDPALVRVTLVCPAGATAERMEADYPACLDDLVTVSTHRSSPGAHLVARSFSRPVTAARHGRPDLLATVADLLSRQSFDLVHVEQPHALENVPDTAPPILLRTQNVELDLWRQMATLRRPPVRWGLSFEAARVARWERAALRRAQQVVAISAEDRDRLISLAGDGPRAIEVIHPAIPSSQAAGPALEGDPALSLFASSTWGPNRDGAQFFLARSWPRIRAARPSCRLHVFGGDPVAAAGPGVRHHPAPFATEDAFGAGALVVVPVRAASGVRMKILDAWSRGLAVVTTETGAVGLGQDAGDLLQPADSLDDLQRAVERLANHDAAREQVQRGREWLRHNTEPALVGSAFLAAYRRVAGRQAT